MSFLGDGVPVYLELIKEHIKIPYYLAPAGANRQRAASIAALGEIYYVQGKSVEAHAHKPEYMRMSQAEREQGTILDH